MTVQTIDAHQASITTATVAVKTLTIADKQMTLSVFRQLREWDLVDETFSGVVDSPDKWHIPPFMTWAERIWGYVNYWWPGAEEPERGGYHVVVSVDFGSVLPEQNGLYRCIVPRTAEAHPLFRYWHYSPSIAADEYDRLEQEFVRHYRELTRHIYERGQLFIAV